MTEKKEVPKRETPKCNKCGSHMVYLRIKEKARVCRSCGFVDKEAVA